MHDRNEEERHDDTENADDLSDLLNRGFHAAGADARRDEPPVDPSVIRRLGEMLGKPTTVSLRALDDDGIDPMDKPPSPAQQAICGTDRYMVQGMLGEGGVGAVHRGHDNDLGRDVALKFLHERHTRRPDVLQRFVEEAQIGGQLQHPGIVPVYELGITEGRPFIAMKMIKGQTLAQRLNERESVATERRTFLAVFEQVCQTIAYAHARGVVHRDLKPANIMIGSFGEVQVVDWGMGKVLGRGGGLAEEQLAAEPEQTVATVRSGESGTRSVMGAVMGTPAYMPPEQARGDIDGMDARSDVFALGAILCELLTGNAPYVGTPDEVLRMAALGDLSDATQRLHSCGAEPELIELALACLASSPGLRPRSASAVAKAVHEHLSGAEARADAARVEAAEARGREASLRRVQRLGALLIVVIVAGLMTSLLLWRAASEQRVIAVRESKEASMAREAAETSLGNFNRLSYVVRLRSAKTAAQALFPAWPEQSQGMREWLVADAGQMLAALPELRETLGSLRRRALPAEGDAGDTAPRFAEPADLFLFDTLTALVADIETFTAGEVRSVKRRLWWSERVEELTVDRHREKWAEARRAIQAADDVVASKLYADQAIELNPQLGLVPIGMNPVTKLWEFYHLRSAWSGSQQDDPRELPIPEHQPDGRIDAKGLGIIFVLVPGGRFAMGAQRTDPSATNYDPAANRQEGPVHEVALHPYFLARHELTQGQWERLTCGQRPSWYQQGVLYAGGPEPVGPNYPVEQVSWTMCSELMRQHGLLLPTEAQWENGCRAGTSTPWASGKTPASLEGTANVLDLHAMRVPPEWVGGEDFIDGYKSTSPVGAFTANAYGMHDMHGNVFEWCRDRFGAYTAPVRDGDGLRLTPPGEETYPYRGGSCRQSSGGNRVALRDRVPPSLYGPELGMRAARAIQP